MTPETLTTPTLHMMKDAESFVTPDAAGATPSAGGTAEHIRVRQAIDYLVDHAQEQPSLETVADFAGLSPHHFQRVFKRFAGISPKKFLQYLTLQNAKQALIEDASVLDAALDAGLSGPSRLHDLFVNCEAMTPGEFKALGPSLEIRYGIHDTAIGRVMIGVTERGICWLAFVAGDGRPAEDEFAAAWKGATLIADQAATASWVERAFAFGANGGKPLPLLIRGTNFQIKVWEALLRIPFGRLVTYQHVAEAIGNPKAVRAVGSAVGKNNISWLIPCHRVILSSGVMHNYRWGVRQKKILNAFEAGMTDAVGA
ncbi:MAG: methylated-DNA--[protein]-cysteine S-methyltransferase [Pseudomonadota bacterium]